MCKIEENENAPGIQVAQKALSTVYGAILARTCALMEAVLENETQCRATKNTFRGILKEETNKFQSYLAAKSRANVAEVGEYARDNLF